MNHIQEKIILYVHKTKQGFLKVFTRDKTRIRVYLFAIVYFFKNTVKIIQYRQI